MPPHCPARCAATARLLLRCRRTLSSRDSNAAYHRGFRCRVATAPQPQQYHTSVCCQPTKGEAPRQRRMSAAATAAPSASDTDTAGSETTAAVAEPPPEPAVSNANSDASPVRGLADAPYTAEQLVTAHLAAIENARNKAHEMPAGGIPAEWAGLEPLPPNTKPPPGEQHADARRALWRVLNHKQPYCCPACRQPIYKVDVLHRHLRACCPDLVTPPELALLEGPEAALREMLRAAALREAALQRRAMDLGFRELGHDGQPIRRNAAQVAQIMGVREKRVKTMLKLAMKAIPLQHDDVPLSILYEDDHILALNKPPGVLTAPKHRYIGGSMVNRIIPYLGRQPHVLHRLDMYTSGVVIFGKTMRCTTNVHAQFRRRTVDKSYLAIAAGVPQDSEFAVDAPIDRHEADKIARVTTSAAGLPSSTAFRVLSASPTADLSSGRAGQFMGPAGAPDRGAALVSCRPHTGRTHQIRVHLGHVGHPILGDDFYGVCGPWIGRQALHAASLEINHPATGERISFKAPPLQDFRDAMQALELTCPDDF